MYSSLRRHSWFTDSVISKYAKDGYVQWILHFNMFWVKNDFLSSFNKIKFHKSKGSITAWLRSNVLLKTPNHSLVENIINISAECVSPKIQTGIDIYQALYQCIHIIIKYEVIVSYNEVWSGGVIFTEAWGYNKDIKHWDSSAAYLQLACCREFISHRLGGDLWGDKITWGRVGAQSWGRGDG